MPGGTTLSDVSSLPMQHVPQEQLAPDRHRRRRRFQADSPHACIGPAWQQAKFVPLTIWSAVIIRLLSISNHPKNLYMQLSSREKRRVRTSPGAFSASRPPSRARRLLHRRAIPSPGACASSQAGTAFSIRSFPFAVSRKGWCVASSSAAPPANRASVTV